MSAQPLPMPINPALLKHADHQWQTVQEEEQQDEELLRLSNQILELTKAIHAMNLARSPTSRDGT